MNILIIQIETEVMNMQFCPPEKMSRVYMISSLSDLEKYND